MTLGFILETCYGKGLPGTINKVIAYSQVCVCVFVTCNPMVAGYVQHEATNVCKPYEGRNPAICKPYAM